MLARAQSEMVEKIEKTRKISENQAMIEIEIKFSTTTQESGAMVGHLSVVLIMQRSMIWIAPRKILICTNLIALRCWQQKR